MSVHEPDAAEAGNTEAQATSGERTDTGIYTGVEKYAKEDNPQYNPAYDSATGKNTGAGVPPDTTHTARHVGHNDGKRAGSQGSDSGLGGALPDRFVQAALHPAPAPSAQHLIETYPHLYPQVEKKEAERKLRESKAEEDKKLKKDGDDSSIKDSKNKLLREKVQIFDGDQKIAERETSVTEREAAADFSGNHEHHHHGIAHSLAHALHLDHADRKEKLHKKDQLEEEMEAYRERALLAHGYEPRERSEHEMRRLSVTSSHDGSKQTDHAEKADKGASDRSVAFPVGQRKEGARGADGVDVPSGGQVEADAGRTDQSAERAARASADGANAGGAVSNSRQHDTIPLEILNPEGLKRKEEEDEILKSGGDYMHFDRREPVASGIPSDRINQLVQAEHQRKSAGLPVHSQMDPKDFTVAFHTADSFESPDRPAP